MFPDYLGLGLGILIKSFGLYFTVISLCYFFKKPEPFPHMAPSTKFACLIPARNEEAVIGDLISCLLNQNYPKELIDVFVIPNNCTDCTESISKKAGAHIIRAGSDVKSKGAALNRAIRRLLPDSQYDAFLIFDADNVLNSDYLSAMNDALASGARICKSKMESKNPYDSWVSGCYGLYFELFNKFFNTPRAALGLSPKLVGTGMAVKRDVFIKMGGWNTETIAEDTEFSAECALRREQVSWVPGAIAYDESPISFSISLIQRKRWISGIMDVAIIKIGDLVRELCLKHYYSSSQKGLVLDSIMILLAPFFQVISVLPGAILFASATVKDTGMLYIHAVLLGLIISFSAAFAFALMLASSSRYDTKFMLKAAFMFPIFTASWVPLAIVSCINRTTEWKEIKHTRSASFSHGSTHASAGYTS